MRTVGLLALVAVLAACGNSAGTAANLSNFTGAPWSGYLVVSGSCDDGSSLATTTPEQIQFQSSGPNELQYDGLGGCTFKFSVSGDTATLSNGPVVCTVTSNGKTTSNSYFKYTATTHDGHKLTADLGFSATQGSVFCNATGSGSGTR